MARSNQQEHPEPVPIEAVRRTQRDSEAEVAESIRHARRRQGRDDLRREFEIQQEVADIVLESLHGRGRFFADCDRSYFFFSDDKQLVAVDPGDSEYRLLMHRFGINPTEKIYRYLAEALANEAMDTGKRAGFIGWLTRTRNGMSPTFSTTTIRFTGLHSIR